MNLRLQRVALATTVFVCAIAPLVSCAAGANSQLTDGVRQGEVQQNQIKTQVQRATDDLTSIINELNRNGIGGEDVKTLVKIRDMLGDLTGKDMATVIALLQEARGAADPGRFREGAAQAVNQQGQIIVKMRQLLLEYKRQQELYELSLRFTELAQRENQNLKDAKLLVRQLGNNASYNELQKSSKTLQTGEQEAIRDETHGLLEKLASVASEADTDTADRLHKSIAQAEQGRLEDSLRAAATNLKESKLFAAATAEKNSRDRLYELASLVAPVEDSATKLRKAAEKLDKAIAEQKVVIGQTDLLPDRAQPNNEAFLKVEDRQADNVDVTDRLRKEIDIIAPTVTEVLKSGQDQMQSARTALMGSQRSPAMTNEKAALAKLEEARKLLDQQIAKAEEDKPKGDNLEQAKALRERVAQLRMEQEKLNDQTRTATARNASELSKAEAKLQQIAKDLQIESAPQSLPAANEMSAAAKEMDKAQTSLDKAAASEAQPAQKLAVDHLVAAERQLEQQIAKLEHDKQELAKLEEAREKVAKLIQDEQRVASDTATEAGKQEAQNQPPATQPQQPNNAAAKDGANKEIAQKQTDVARKTDETRQSLPESGKDAAPRLEDARQGMNSAKNDLQDNNPRGAQRPEQQALDDLNKAKDALDRKVSELQKELGQPQDNTAKLDDLAHALDKAQQDLNNVQQQMSQSPAQQLAQQQQQVADSLQQQQQQQQQPNDQQLQKAQQAAQQAAQNLQQNQVPQAIQQMQKAQDAMQNAMTQSPPQQGHQQGQPQQQGQQQQNQSSQPKQGEQGQKGQQGQQGQKGEGQEQGNQPGQQGQQGQAQGQQQAQGAQQGQQPSQQAKGQGQQGPQGQQGGHGGTPGSISDLAQQQAAIQKAAEQLAAAQAQQQMEQAAQQLGQVANNVTDAAANDKGALPNSAQQALQQAESALNEATANAQAGNKTGAQSQATSAQTAITQAQAAIAMAQQGMQPGQMADGSQPQQGQPGKAGQTPSPGSPAPGATGQTPGQGNENTASQATGDRQDTQAKAGTGGPRGNVAGNSTYLHLPARDRQAIQQTQKDKYPEEYGPAIEQYLKNLSDQENK